MTEAEKEHLREYLFENKTGLSIRGIAAITEIHYPDLMAWINQTPHRGKPRNFPDRHVEKLLEHLKNSRYEPPK